VSWRLIGAIVVAVLFNPTSAWATECVNDPASDPVALCANADPHVWDPQPAEPGTGVSAAASTTLFVNGSPTPVCVARAELAVNVPSGPEGGVDGPVIRRCY
jgi:hypothetical protein